MYISSPGYPKTLNEPGTCEISIDTDPFENRQIRLDFVAFDMVSARYRFVLSINK